jgi:hypothetical protein
VLLLYLRVLSGSVACTCPAVRGCDIVERGCSMPEERAQYVPCATHPAERYNVLTFLVLRLCFKWKKYYKLSRLYLVISRNVNKSLLFSKLFNAFISASAAIEYQVKYAEKYMHFPAY